MDFKYNGIILSKKDVGETDRIYTIFTKEAGKIRTLAKGVRRPNAKLAGHLEPLTYAEVFVAKTKGLGKITGSVAVENFPRIKSDLEALTQLSYAIGILEKIIAEQEKDEKIFELLLAYFEALEKLEGEKSGSKKAILTLGFLFKLLGEAGYQLEVTKCVNCGNKLKLGSNYFSAAQGGILCADCRALAPKKFLIDDNSVKFIRIFSQNKVGSLVKLDPSKKDAANLSTILNEALGWIGK